MTVKTLEEARKRIKELEKEVAALKAENEELRGRNFGGRRKHDEKWKAAYNELKAKAIKAYNQQKDEIEKLNNIISELKKDKK